MNVSKIESFEQETNGQPNDLERVDYSVRQNQVREKKNDDQISRGVSSAVMTVENCMLDTILAA